MARVRSRRPLSQALPTRRWRQCAGFRPCHAGNGRDLFNTNRANRTRNCGGAGYFHAGSWRHNRNDAIGFRGTDDTRSSGYLFHVRK